MADQPHAIEHTHLVGTGSTALYPWCPACGTAALPAAPTEEPTPHA